jgi:hypothetical protein
VKTPGKGKGKAKSQIAEDDEDSDDTSTPRPVQTRGKGKRQVIVEDDEDSEDSAEDSDDTAEDSDDTAGEGDEAEDAGETKRPAKRPTGKGWTVPKRKRLKQEPASKKKKNHYGIDRIVDYEVMNKNGAKKVKVVWSDAGAKPKIEWIPYSHLVQPEQWADTFKVIDMWKASTIKKFEDYLDTSAAKKVTRSQRTHGWDGVIGNCGYEGVGVALKLLGLNNHVTKEYIEKFRAAGQARRTQTSHDDDTTSGTPSALTGVTKSALHAFINGCDDRLDKVTAKKNLYKGNGQGIAGLKNLELADGIYLAGGHVKSRDVGHIFVIEIEDDGEHVSLHEKDDVHDVKWLEWMYDISFVYRFQKLD